MQFWHEAIEQADHRSVFFGVCGGKAKLSAPQVAEPLSLTVLPHSFLRGTLAAEKVMSNQNIFSTLIVTWVVVPSLAVFLGAGPARAQNISANYTFLVASGLLCDPGDSATCPAVVKSANDDSYEMSGAGSFDAQSKSVTAAGTFTHKSSDGTVLEAGVWVVGELVSFDSYGIAPGELMSGGPAFGPQSSAQSVCQYSLAPCQQAVSRYSVFSSRRCRKHRRPQCCR